ncbi:hypothetical protein BGZ95_006555 [Linnemannia exigua]|uniref:Uncharacterized protein n=1 Tax=Linnemannia exigua TaxID=604196 RepID=A0AAD4H220_9FUNG|nr:hypothetical protein BGZ95_006555 [Linnemannia exigua]
MHKEEETPRERFLNSQGILSTVEWVDDLQDQHECAKVIALFEMRAANILKALKDVQAKRFSRFLKDAVLAISRPIKAIHRIKEYIAADSSTPVKMVWDL